MLLSKAQALLHVGRDRDAAAAADAAIAMIDRNPALAPYRLLALDWAAVDNLAAGRFARALALYDEEIPLLDASRTPLARAQSNRGARLARGRGGRGRTSRRARSPTSTTSSAPRGPEGRGDALDGRTRPPSTWSAPTGSSRPGCARTPTGSSVGSTRRRRRSTTRRAILEERFGETSRAEIEQEADARRGAARDQREPAPRRGGGGDLARQGARARPTTFARGPTA